MIAAVSHSLSTDNLPVNWFDGTILIVLGFGLFRGRKNGMTKEVIPLIQWIAIVITAGLCWSFVADFYHTTCGLSSKLSSAVFGYLSIALVIFIIFSFIKKAVQPRLTGSNVFGNSEYYLGIPSGILRYACILIFALALIHAKFYTSAEIAATKAYNQKWYGGGIYSGNYTPDLHEVQDDIFKQSFTGPYIKDYLGILLIQTGPDDAAGSSGAPGAKKPQGTVHIGN